MEVGGWGPDGSFQQDGAAAAGRPTMGKLIRCFAAVLAAVLVFLTASTIGRITDFSSRGPEAEDIGMAAVRECTEYGPVSRFGFGTTYVCSADVRWNGGRTTRVEFPAGQLSPTDKGRVVEVFDAPDSRTSGPGYGRNDPATWYVIGLVTTILMYFIAVMLAITAFGYALAVFRQSGHPPRLPGENRDRTSGAESRRRRVADEWPVSDADKAALPRQRKVRRVRLLALVSLGVIVIQLLSSIPRNDAPRALNFVSPWPQIEQAWLIRPLDLGVFLIGMALAALLWSMAKVAEMDAARLVRYGLPFLTRNVPGKKKSVNAELKRLEQGRRSSLVGGMVIGVAVLGLATFAGLRAFAVMPAGAPQLVALSVYRDALVLSAVGIVLLATVEAKHDRLSRLLQLHRQRQVAGTDTRVGES